MSNKLVETPVTDKLSESRTPPAGTKCNGEPGLPQRTTSSQSVTEVTYDRNGPKGQQK